jgi:hypothetical protein
VPLFGGKQRLQTHVGLRPVRGDPCFPSKLPPETSPFHSQNFCDGFQSRSLAPRIPEQPSVNAGHPSWNHLPENLLTAVPPSCANTAAEHKKARSGAKVGHIFDRGNFGASITKSSNKNVLQNALQKCSTSSTRASRARTVQNWNAYGP